MASFATSRDIADLEISLVLVRRGPDATNHLNYHDLFRPYTLSMTGKLTIQPFIDGEGFGRFLQW